jgi:hypothetical protein
MNPHYNFMQNQFNNGNNNNNNDSYGFFNNNAEMNANGHRRNMNPYNTYYAQMQQNVEDVNGNNMECSKAYPSHSSQENVSPTQMNALIPNNFNNSLVNRSFASYSSGISNMGTTAVSYETKRMQSSVVSMPAMFQESYAIPFNRNPQQAFNYPQMYVNMPQQQQQQISPPIEKKSRITRNLISHSDTTLRIQESILVAGEVDGLTGVQNIVDLECIWAKVYGKPSSQMKLGFRLINRSGCRAKNVRIKLAPNSFGLSLDPSADPVMDFADPENVKMVSVSLFCFPEKQRINQSTLSGVDDSIMSLDMQITYENNGRILSFSHQTSIPLFLFFQDHFQNYDSALFPSSIINVHDDRLSATENGPRLTQNAFLNIWKTDTDLGFQIPHSINWKSWYASLAQELRLSFFRADPVLSDLIKVLECKLSMNRIFVVASREVNAASMRKDVVLFVSFKVSNGQSSGGQLVVGEIRFIGDSGWESAVVKICTKLNRNMYGALRKSMIDILTS